MKKLMFGMAVAAGLMACADIESANTVGFTTKELSANSWFLANTQFQDVGKDGFANLNSLVQTSVAPGIFETMEADAPQLQVLSPKGGYNLYFLISDAYDAEGNEVTGWADLGGDLVTDDVQLGFGFWYKAISAATLTFKGEVSNADTLTVSVPKNNFKIVGNPFPAALDLSKITTSFAPGVFDTMETEALQIQVLSPKGGYNLYYYISDAYDSEGNEVEGWADLGGDLVTEPIEVGAGFWVKAPADGTMTFTK